MFARLLLILLALPLLATAQVATSVPQAEALLMERDWGPTPYALIVDPATQRMYLYENGERTRTFVISTCKHGLRNRKGWQGTPTGLHRIKEKHGDGLPLGAVLDSREFTGDTARIYTDKTDVPDDLITTRILWLQGLEPGHNRGGDVDTYERYIYIHGTPEEGLLGTPASHGCIRMKNRAVLALFKRLPVGTLVYIVDSQ
ncbi:MAG: L,D-transpeptidase family protein [Bacteroidota bacterium]